MSAGAQFDWSKFDAKPVNAPAFDWSKFDGKPVTAEPSPAQKEEEKAGFVGRLVERGKGMVDLLRQNVSPMTGMVNPFGVARDVGTGLIQQHQEAGQEYLQKAATEPNPLRNVERFLEAGFPALGPFYRGLRKDVEKGDPGAATADTALALLPAARIPKAVRSGIATAAEGAATKTFNSIIKPSVKDFDFGKNPGLAVAKEQLTANSAEGLLQKIAARKQEVGQQIGQAMRAQGSGKQVNVLKIMDDVIDSARRDALRGGNKALENSLLEFRTTLWEEWKTAKPSKMGIADAFDFKKAIADQTRFSGADANVLALNEVRKRLYGRVSDAIEQQIPAIRSLNQRYSNLITAEKGLDHTIRVAQRQNAIGMLDAVFAGTGYVGGGPAGAAALFALRRASKSPFVLTRTGAAAQKVAESASRPRISGVLDWLKAAPAATLTQKPKREYPWDR